MKPFSSKQNCTALNFQPRSALQNFCKMLSNTMRYLSPHFAITIPKFTITIDSNTDVHTERKTQHRSA